MTLKPRTFHSDSAPAEIRFGACIGMCYGPEGFDRRSRMTPMQIARQLAIFLENRPGMLARVADALAEAKINIYAISTSDTVDHIVMRLVVSDHQKALHVFEARGALVVEDDVLMIEGSNRPGSLSGIAHKLADAGINIEYAYCATAPDARKGLLILRVRNVHKALKVLNS
jgi:hypothetical protein